jgi:hypothetical protein
MSATVRAQICIEDGIAPVLAVPERPVPNGVRAG